MTVHHRAGKSSRVIVKVAVAQRGAAVVVVHPTRTPVGTVRDKHAVPHRRTASKVEHPATTVVRKRIAVGVAAGDGKALQNGACIRPAAGNDVVAVLGPYASDGNCSRARITIIAPDPD